MVDTKEATLAEIKKYFEYPTMTTFRSDWAEISDKEKKYFRKEVATVTK